VYPNYYTNDQTGWF